MTGADWKKLDNASLIFVATRSPVDPKVFRIGASLTEEVDPDLLQQAVDIAYDNNMLFHYGLRRGLFWDVLIETKDRPKVIPETQAPCRPIWNAKDTPLMIEVSYYKKRINLEVFHALTDGTGAIWFMESIIIEYFRLRYPDRIYPEASKILSDAESLDDAFSHYFGSGNAPETHPIRSVVLGAGKALTKLTIQSGKKVLSIHKGKTARQKARKRRGVYHIRGYFHPDFRVGFAQFDMDAGQVLAKAKALGTSLTVYTTALYFMAILRAYPDAKNHTLAVSVPVNLRGIFESSTYRNFFATVRLAYTFGRRKKDDLQSVCRVLGGQLKEAIRKENLQKTVSVFNALESNLLARMTITPIKDLVLKIANFFKSQGLTVAMTNLGRLVFDPSVDDYVRDMPILLSVARPQFSCISHAGILTIVHLTPFMDTRLQEAFKAVMEEEGIEVTENKTYPYVPLEINENRAVQLMALASILVLVLAFILHFFLKVDVNWFVMALAGIASIWSVYWSVFQRKRRPLISVFRALILGSLLFVLWDYLIGWRGWSIDYAIPIFAIAGLLTTQILSLIADVEPENAIFLGATIAGIALLPLAFVLTGLAKVTFPSMVSFVLGLLVLALMSFRHGRELVRALIRRLKP